MVRVAPIGTDHTQKHARSRDHRHALARVDSRIEKYLQILASGHESAVPDIRNHDPLTRPQSLATGRSGVRADPFPAFDRFHAEALVGQEFEFPGGTSLRLDHLNAGQVSVQNRQRGIEDLVVQLFHPEPVTNCAMTY